MLYAVFQIADPLEARIADEWRTEHEVSTLTPTRAMRCREMLLVNGVEVAGVFTY